MVLLDAKHRKAREVEEKRVKKSGIPVKRKKVPKLQELQTKKSEDPSDWEGRFSLNNKKT